MKKAKEHYQDYLAEAKIFGDQIATIKLAERIWAEAHELIQIRQCQTPLAKVAVYRELCAKWDAICKLDPRFKRGGLRELMVDKIPTLAKEQFRRALT